MEQNQNETASENDVRPAGEKTLDFDDGTLRGEKKSLILFTRRFQCINPAKFGYPLQVWPTTHGVC